MARKPSKPTRLAAAPLDTSAPILESAELGKIVDCKLRIREDLHQRIERAAEANRVSANREMINRITASFDYKATRTIEEIAADMDVMWTRYGKVFLDLATRGDLIRAAETLVEAVEQLPASAQKPVKEAIERVKAATSIINIEATAGMRRFKT